MLYYFQIKMAPGSIGAIFKRNGNSDFNEIKGVF